MSPLLLLGLGFGVLALSGGLRTARNTTLLEFRGLGIAGLKLGLTNTTARLKVEVANASRETFRVAELRGNLFVRGYESAIGYVAHVGEFQALPGMSQTELNLTLFTLEAGTVIDKVLAGTLPLRVRGTAVIDGIEVPLDFELEISTGLGPATASPAPIAPGTPEPAFGEQGHAPTVQPSYPNANHC